MKVTRKIVSMSLALMVVATMAASVNAESNAAICGAVPADENHTTHYTEQQQIIVDKKLSDLQ